MKIKAAILSAVLACIIVTSARAEQSTVDLSLPKNLASKVCSKPVWSGVKAVWDGTFDGRKDKHVGEQKAGDKTRHIMSKTPINKLFDRGLRQVFEKCGIKFIDKGDKNALHISASIEEFYAGSQKKFLTGKAKASCQLTISQRKGTLSSESTFTHEIESKKLRSGKLKHITNILNDLLAEALEQIPSQPALEKLL